MRIPRFGERFHARETIRRHDPARALLLDVIDPCDPISVADELTREMEAIAAVTVHAGVCATPAQFRRLRECYDEIVEIKEHLRARYEDAERRRQLTETLARA